MIGTSTPADQAVFRPSKWPGLIWAVPLAASGIIFWLSLSVYLRSGPSVEVSFPVTGGLKPGTTKIEYKGYVVGHIGAVKLDKALNQMRVTLNFDAPMQHHLGPGTRFWLIGTSLSLNNLASVKDIISGPVIGVDPHPGKTVAKAQGLSTPPPLPNDQPGLRFTLWTRQLGHLASGSPIYFKDYKVGQVLWVKMAPDGSRFTIQAFIEQPWEGLVKADSRFWNAGAVRFSTDGSGPSLQLQSVPALLKGAIAFETPAGAAALPAAPGFQLFSSKDQARANAGPGAVSYATMFPGGPRGLQPGALVQLEGQTAGSVTQVSLRYDPAQGALQTLVRFTLQPQRIGLSQGSWNFADARPQMDAMINTLIGKGLRAEMGSSVPVVGGKVIRLEIAKDAPPATLSTGDPPCIPSFGGTGGDVSQITMHLDNILTSINAMKLDQISANVQNATSRLAALANAPRTRQSLRDLNRTMAYLDEITRRADARLPAILQAVQRSANQAQAALAATRGLLNTQGPGNAAPDESDLPHTLYELSQAANSLRNLADFLNSHPGALIAGRSD